MWTEIQNSHSITAASVLNCSIIISDVFEQLHVHSHKRTTDECGMRWDSLPLATFCSTGLNNTFSSSAVFFLSSFFAILSAFSFSSYKMIGKHHSTDAMNTTVYGCSVIYFHSLGCNCLELGRLTLPHHSTSRLEHSSWSLALTLHLQKAVLVCLKIHLFELPTKFDNHVCLREYQSELNWFSAIPCYLYIWNNSQKYDASLIRQSINIWDVAFGGGIEIQH